MNIGQPARLLFSLKISQINTKGAHRCRIEFRGQVVADDEWNELSVSSQYDLVGLYGSGREANHYSDAFLSPSYFVSVAHCHQPHARILLSSLPSRKLSGVVLRPASLHPMQSLPIIKPSRKKPSQKSRTTPRSARPLTHKNTAQFVRFSVADER